MITRTFRIASFAAALSTLAGAAGAEPPLTIVSWGGAYTKSQMLAFIQPYRQTTDLWVNVETYGGGLAEVRAQVESLNVKWDVVDVLLSDAVRGCEDGLFEPIDHSVLEPAPDGTPASEDFIEGALRECAVGQNLWSTVVAYNSERTTNAPGSIADFFDTSTYPGPRGLQKSPRVNLEWALMADGVPADQVYQVLSTEQGVDRAFRVLDRIRGNIVWWEDGSQPPRMLANGDVVMSSAWNGRIYSAIVEREEPLNILWDGQIWDLELWAIPKGSLRKEEALDFIAFATAPQRLAEQAQYIAYGPARQSAMAMVPDEVKAQLPTAEGHMANALRNDFEWWAEHQDEMDARFARWLEAPTKTPAALAR